MLRVAVFSIHTCPLAPLGGWETGGLNVYVRELSRELSELGVGADIFTRRQDPTVPAIVELAANARVIHVDGGPPRHFDKYAVLDYTSEIACNVQRYRNFLGARYDLIHAHYWLSARLGLLFKEHWRVPMATMFHTLGEMKNRVALSSAESEQQVRVEIERRAMLGSDVVIASTEVDRAQMVNTYRADPRNITVVPGGVDLSLFRPGDQEDARRELGLPGGPLLLFAGRIQRLKGIDVLIRAAAILRSDLPGLNVVVVGGGAGTGDGESEDQRELRRLRAIAAEESVEDIVRFVGGAEQAKLRTYYRAADLTVMPSTYESFGLVAVESMACGTPVVATRVGGLSTIVRDGENGFLVPWRDPRLFADRIRLALKERGTLERLRSGARQTGQHYSWAAVADRTRRVYQSLATPAAVARG
ncbi:MAG: glycosyltransferase [Chloroflexota bacterium]